MLFHVVVVVIIVLSVMAVFGLVGVEDVLTDMLVARNKW
jgi:hypothetical protein